MPMMTGHFERLIQVMLFYVANSRHGSVIVWNLTSEDDQVLSGLGTGISRTIRNAGNVNEDIKMCK